MPAWAAMFLEEEEDEKEEEEEEEKEEEEDLLLGILGASELCSCCTAGLADLSVRGKIKLLSYPREHV